jgi:peptidyl-prolyl cis-trans isomerase SurA
MNMHSTIRLFTLAAMMNVPGGTLAIAQTQTPVQTHPPTPATAPATAKTQGRADSEATVHTTTAPVAETAPIAKQGVLVDQVIGVVNGDLILESDVEEERHFSAFQPFRDPGGKFSRENAIERLVDRALILQQAKLQPDGLATTPEVKAELSNLRKEIPACTQYHCETDAGWEKFVADQGFTLDELTERWRQRMEILKFIELRFRAGIRISPEEIKNYYQKTLLPEYARLNAKAPVLDKISDRIQEVLLQQKVGNLLSDWLESLKAQGTVRMIKPGEVTP